MHKILVIGYGMLPYQVAVMRTVIRSMITLLTNVHGTARRAWDLQLLTIVIVVPLVGVAPRELWCRYLVVEGVAGHRAPQSAGRDHHAGWGTRERLVARARDQGAGASLIRSAVAPTRAGEAY